MGNDETKTVLYRPSARAAARFRACTLQSRASGAHSHCDAYHDGWCRHLSTIIPPLYVLRRQEQPRAKRSSRLVDSARGPRGSPQNCDQSLMMELSIVIFW